MTMTSAEVAQALGVDAATVRRLRAKANLPRRKRGQGYTEEECARLCAQLRYHPRAHNNADSEQLHASGDAQAGAPDELSHLRRQVEALESRVEGLEALLTTILAVPWSIRAGVSDSPAAVPAVPPSAPPRLRRDGRKLPLPTAQVLKVARKPAKPPLQKDGKRV
jgi:DNA-binding transcriptional MerR regulator